MTSMARDTQPQSPDQLYARVIFTAEEYSALTPDQFAMLDDDLLENLDHYRSLGWDFDVEDVVDSTIRIENGPESASFVVSKSVSARAFGVVS